MRRVIVGLVAALLAAVVVAPSVAAAPASARVPKVVLIVGPSGAATDRYREEARAAAALARTYTPDVTELYSPDATWPAVKKALQGASVVVYMGHGNGWPSRYRDQLYPPTQNGFGLNPSAGGGDDEHQYFGEARIAESIRLARNAVVLLNHLCYASGNTEPGLPEGTLDMARQRVDNFAAGFIRAGASAVIAEAQASPNYMLRAVLRGRGGIEAAWRAAPTANDNTFAFDSVRSKGYVAQMDPEHPESGFTRSIVLKRGLASADVLRNARGRGGSAAAIDPIELAPTLSGSGLKLKTPSLRATFAGSAAWYRIPYTASGRDALPDGLQASVRWDPLDAPSPEPPGPDAAADPDSPPDFGLVVAERIGEVVAPTPFKVDEKNLSIKVANPVAPGRYRLTVTLHDKEGVAYDAATQAMVAGLLVRLTGPYDAVVVAPQSVEVEQGATQSMTVWVTNVGHQRWGVASVPGARTRDNESKRVGPAASTNAIVSGTWVTLGVDRDGRREAAAAAATVTPGDLPAGLDTRGVAKTDVVLTAPTATGDYLLVIDIVTPESGSLAALGVDPTVVRVHVTAAPSEPAGGGA